MPSEAQDAMPAENSELDAGLRLALKIKHPAATLGIILDVTGVPLSF